MEWNSARWPAEFTIERMQAACLALVMRLLHENSSACKHGITILVDFAGASTQQVAGITSSDRQRGWALLQGNIPVRIANIIVVNEGMPVTLLLWAVRAVASSKMWARLQRCGSDRAALHQLIPPATLPRSLGGSLDEGQLQSSWAAYVEQRLPSQTPAGVPPSQSPVATGTSSGGTAEGAQVHSAANTSPFSDGATATKAALHDAV
jgi:hypothetical protein